MPKESYKTFAHQIADAIPGAGCDTQRGGWYDMMERTLKDGEETTVVFGTTEKHGGNKNRVFLLITLWLEFMMISLNILTMREKVLLSITAGSLTMRKVGFTSTF